MQNNNVIMLSCVLLALSITLSAMDAPTPRTIALSGEQTRQLESASFSELPEALQKLVIKNSSVCLYLQAIKDNDIKTTKTLLSQGVHVDARYNEAPQSTPVMYAVLEARREMVDVLLDHGADVNLQNTNGNSAKFLAIRNASGLLKNPGIARFSIARAICLKEQIPVPEEVLDAESLWKATLML